MCPMANFNRGNRSGGGRSFEKRSFNDRGSRGPAQMHQAVCDNCGKNCEVPFRPTSGKPVFCSNCFENNRGSERPGRFGDRQMFDAVCNNCGNDCKVPFQPSSGKPIYCSNCFGDKKENTGRDKGQFQPQYKEQFVVLNNKLDKILTLLESNTSVQAEAPKLQEEVVNIEQKKPTRKKAPKKEETTQP